MSQTPPTGIEPIDELCRAQFESAALGRFEVQFSRGCAPFIGRFALLSELRGGDGVIRFAALADDVADRSPPLT